MNWGKLNVCKSKNITNYDCPFFTYIITITILPTIVPNGHITNYSLDSGNTDKVVNGNKNGIIIILKAQICQEKVLNTQWLR